MGLGYPRWGNHPTGACTSSWVLSTTPPGWGLVTQQRFGLRWKMALPHVSGRPVTPKTRYDVLPCSLVPEREGRGSGVELDRPMVCFSGIQPQGTV